MTTFAGMTSYLADALANASLRNTTYTSPATVYLALFSAAGTFTAAGTELVTGTSPGYARVACTWTAPSDGSNVTTLTLAADVVMPTPTGDWLQAVSWEIYDALTSGHRLFAAPLATPVTAKNGVPLVFLTGTNPLTITLGGAQV